MGRLLAEFAEFLGDHRPWWIVPLALLGLGLIALAAWSGGDDGRFVYTVF